MSAKVVICERGRVDELADALADAGVAPGCSPVLVGSFAPGARIEWVGMHPSPNGGTFDLHAPEGVEDQPPEWREYYWRGQPHGWNYTRDLVAFRVAEQPA